MSLKDRLYFYALILGVFLWVWFMAWRMDIGDVLSKVKERDAWVATQL